MATAIRNLKTISDKKLPIDDGKYCGIWGGYNVEIPLMGKPSIIFTVDIGVKGKNNKCIVNVKGGYGYVQID